MRTITNQMIRDAYYEAVEGDYLGTQGACSYIGRCIVGVTLNDNELLAIQRSHHLDSKPALELVECGIVQFEDITYVTRLQEAFDARKFKPEMLEC